jgi:hypothetical protein
MDGIRNITKILIRITGILVETGTQNLPNTSLELYRYINLFAQQHFM